MMNPDGSGSSACRAIAVDPQAAEAMRRMLADEGWSGIAMVELLRDAAGRAWFMEVNGRTWGSTALARRLGLEYPAWAVGQTLGLEWSAPAAEAAEPQFLCRHLGRELVHLLAVLRGPRNGSREAWPGRLETLAAVSRIRRSDRWYNAERRPVLLADTVETLRSQLRRTRGPVTRTVRAAVHVHSEWSYDAHWPLSKLVSELSGRGYDAMLLADHDRGFDTRRWEDYRAACAAASRPDFLVLPGTEYADPANLVHLPVWGMPFLGADLPTERVLDAVGEHDALALLAHPVRRQAWRGVDPSWLPRLFGIEVWNRKYDGWAPARWATGQAAAHPSIVSVASLDLHTARQLFPLALEIALAGDLVEADVLAALRRRSCRGTAFGRPVTSYTGSVPSTVLRVAEGARRPVAGVVRRLLDSRAAAVPAADPAQDV